MFVSLEIVIPVFLVILSGYVAGKRHWVSSSALKGLSFFVYYLAIPALLFRTMAQGNLSSDIDFSLIIAFYSVSLAIFICSAFLGRFLYGHGLKEAAVMAMGATYGNLLLLGFPLIYSAFGDEGMVPLTMLIAFQAPILMALTSMLTEYDLSREEDSGQGIKAISLSLAKAIWGNPIILGLIAGGIFQLSGFEFIAVLDRFTSILSGAVVPCALFSLGVSLTEFKLAGDLKQSFLIVILKTIIYPSIVAFLVFNVIEVPPLWAAVAVILAAQPTGMNVFILAQQYGVFTARAASVVLSSTILSVVTVTLLIAYYINVLPK
ncbi:AEC family transporter [Kiloniella majae]|uniref:AEC family transporter n=1 Tax=Kiloniella majae TaxID=1938558 RepID=UPI000A277611|nr:AEC family transporter [Kiloniella majae]